MTASPLRIVGSNRPPRPTFEASRLGIMTVRRFLKFAAADLKFQAEEMAREPGHSLDELVSARQTALSFDAYLRALDEGLGQMELKREGES